jgi:hypothetical protein
MPLVVSNGVLSKEFDPPSFFFLSQTAISLFKLSKGSKTQNSRGQPTREYCNVHEMAQDDVSDRKNCSFHAQGAQGLDIVPAGSGRT